MHLVWVRFFLRKTLIWLGMSLVRFGSKRCGSDIIIIYYSCNSWVVNLEQTLQRQWMTWLWCHSQQRQQVNNAIAKLCFGRVLKRSLCAHLLRVKLLLFTFIWMADCTQFRSENRLNGCQILGLFDFLKTESEPNFSFRHIPVTVHYCEYQ